MATIPCVCLAYVVCDLAASHWVNYATAMQVVSNFAGHCIVAVGSKYFQSGLHTVLLGRHVRFNLLVLVYCL